jgi:hypothetical protein
MDPDPDHQPASNPGGMAHHIDVAGSNEPG